MLSWTLEAFAHCALIDTLVLVGAEGEQQRLQTLGVSWGGGKLHTTIVGGATRQESVWRGLQALPNSCTSVVVHDGARCCLTPEAIALAVTEGQMPSVGGATLGRWVTDTLVRSSGEAVDRDGLFAVETPQVFALPTLRQAHEHAHASGHIGTDDAGLVRTLGVQVTLVACPAPNPKVTRPEDLALAEALLLHRMPKAV